MNLGWVYILTNESLKTDYLKIGQTTNDPAARASEISQSTGVATPFRVAYSEAVPDCVRAEALVHSKLAEYRVRANREFFQLELDTARRAVADVCEAVRNESPLCRQCGTTDKLRSTISALQTELDAATFDLERRAGEIWRLQASLRAFRIASLVGRATRPLERLLDAPMNKLLSVPEGKKGLTYFWGACLALGVLGGWLALVVYYPIVPFGIAITLLVAAAGAVVWDAHQDHRGE